MGKVAILFTQKNSIYQTLGVDCWGIDRDATNYKGPHSVVAHPPCRAWGRLRGLANIVPGERELAFFAMDAVRKWGGILEHPAASQLFPEFLPLPGTVDWFGGYTICVNQNWFGHKALKKTMLYIVGCDQNNLPEIPISFDAITHTIGSWKKNSRTNTLPEVTKKEREATPLNLALWLIEVAKRCAK